MLTVEDNRDYLAPFLASLPGTLQTMINTVITVARNRGTLAANSAGGPNQPGPPPAHPIGIWL